MTFFRIGALCVVLWVSSLLSLLDYFLPTIWTLELSNKQLNDMAIESYDSEHRCADEAQRQRDVTAGLCRVAEVDACGGVLSFCREVAKEPGSRGD